MNAPTRWNVSALKKRRAPASASAVREVRTGVRWTCPAMRAARGPHVVEGDRESASRRHLRQPASAPLSRGAPTTPQSRSASSVIASIAASTRARNASSGSPGARRRPSPKTTAQRENGIGTRYRSQERRNLGRLDEVPTGMIGASTASARRRTPYLQRRAGPRGPSGVRAAQRVVPRSASTISTSASPPPRDDEPRDRAVPPPEEEAGDDVAVPALRGHRHDPPPGETEDPRHHPLVPDGVEDGPPRALDRLAVLPPHEADAEGRAPEGDEEEEGEAEQEAAHLPILSDPPTCILPGRAPRRREALPLVRTPQGLRPALVRHGPGESPRRGRRERLGEDDPREDPRRPHPSLGRERLARAGRPGRREALRSRHAGGDRLVRARPRPLRRADARPRTSSSSRASPGARSGGRRPRAGSPGSASTREGSGRSARGSSPRASGSA